MPDYPDLVSSGVAARILGIQGPHVARLRRSGRLVAVPVEGAAGVYLRSEVLVLARVLARERKARERKGTG